MCHSEKKVPQYLYIKKADFQSPRPAHMFWAPIQSSELNPLAGLSQMLSVNWLNNKTLGHVSQRGLLIVSHRTCILHVFKIFAQWGILLNSDICKLFYPNYKFQLKRIWVPERPHGEQEESCKADSYIERKATGILQGALRESLHWQRFCLKQYFELLQLRELELFLVSKYAACTISTEYCEIRQMIRCWRPSEPGFWRRRTLNWLRMIVALDTKC